MSDIERLLAAEAAANINAPAPKGTKVTRPNRARSVPYSIRLNPEELAAVQELATQAQNFTVDVDPMMGDRSSARRTW